MNELARLLNERANVDNLACMVSGRTAYGRIKRQTSVEYDTIHSIQQLHASFADKAVNDERLQELESRYGKPSLRTYVLGDRHYQNYEYREQQRFVQHWFNFYLDLFDDFQPDLLLTNSVAAGPTYIPFDVVRSEYGDAVWWQTVRIQDRYGLTINTPYSEFTDISSLFENFRSGRHDRRNFHIEHKKAKEYYRNFRQERARPAYYSEPDRESMKAYVRRVLTSPFEILEGYIRYNYFTPEEYYIAHDYTALPFHRRVVEHVREGCRTQAVDRLDMFDTISPESEQFIFFPLHVQPEASTMVQAPMYTNQIHVAELMSKAARLTDSVYVKEHPSMIGRRPLNYYRQLREIPNVKLIHPRYDSHRLIESADLVATVTGTAGLEAALYKTPVITFARVFYNTLSTVENVTDPENLPELIERIRKNPQHDREEVIDLLTAIYARSISLPAGVAGPNSIESAEPLYNMIVDNETIAIDSVEARK